MMSILTPNTSIMATPEEMTVITKFYRLQLIFNSDDRGETKIRKISKLEQFKLSTHQTLGKGANIQIT